MQYNQSPGDEEQASPPSLKPFTLVQHNCLGSWDVFLSPFGSFSQLALPPSIVALQDPPAYRGKLPSFNLFTVFSPPTDRGCKPHVAFYVYRSLLVSVSLLPRFFGRGDVMALDLFTPDGFVNPSTTGFTIINSDSTKGRLNNTRSVPPDIVFPTSPLSTLTLCDLNIHQPTGDPLRVFKEDEIATSSPYFDRATELEFTLLNFQGVFTRFSMSLSVRYGASRAPKPAGPHLNSPPSPGQWPGAGPFFFSTPAPAPVQAPAQFNAPNSPPSMNFLHPGPGFFVYSPLEHCSFDTCLSNCVSIYTSLG